MFVYYFLLVGVFYGHKDYKKGQELEQKAKEAQLIIDNWEDDNNSNSVSNVLPSESDKSVKITQLPQSAQSQEIIDVQYVETSSKPKAENSSNSSS